MKMQKKFTIGTLNYSGMITSPYEYYQQEDEYEKRFSKVFSEIVGQQYPDFNDENPKKFSWSTGSLDLKWKNRFSPVNVQNCGVKSDNTLMNEDEFLQEWDKVCAECLEDLITNYFTAKYKPEEVETKKQLQLRRARQFDLFCYRTFIRIIYGTDNVKNLNEQADKYIESRKKDFNKSYLNQQRKLQKTIKMILNSNVDILCFQEANKVLIQGLKNDKRCKNYYVRSDIDNQVDSVILINKLAFQKSNFQMENSQFLALYAAQLEMSKEKMSKRLNFNDDSIFQIIGNYLIFCIHLSSKTDKNERQLEEFKQELSLIKKNFPSLKIIGGGDFNGLLDYGFTIKSEKNTQIKVRVYPNHEEQFTSNKKRTLMQPQRNKANILNCVSKDFLFADNPIKNTSITQFNHEGLRKADKTNLLPSDDHPYDHYLVLGEIKTN